jgi:NitT/TauT family transport system substrate-binding protein
MKKTISAVMVCLFLAAPLTGYANAGSRETALPETVRVSALKGPTAMGMVKLMQDAENGLVKNKYDFKVTVIDEMIPLLSRGELDIASVPANLASVLYNNTKGGIQVLAINTLGVLYVVEKGDVIKSVADLRGKTVLSTGKGATPEFSLNHVLGKNGLDPAVDVNIEYKSEAAEIIPLLARSENGVAIIPQPFVTTALARVEGLRVALDWTKEWDAVAADGSALVTGVTVVNRGFAAKYPEAVRIFAQECEASAAFTKSNLKEAAQLVGKYGIVDAAIAEKAMPVCNITYIDGAVMRDKLSAYLRALFEQNPQSIGGALPNEDFYYIP